MFFIYKNYTKMHGQQNINFHKMLIMQLLFAINMCYYAEFSWMPKGYALHSSVTSRLNKWQFYGATCETKIVLHVSTSFFLIYCLWSDFSE
jgi:hypothetical protein